LSYATYASKLRFSPLVDMFCSASIHLWRPCTLKLVTTMFVSSLGRRTRTKLDRALCLLDRVYGQIYCRGHQRLNSIARSHVLSDGGYHWRWYQNEQFATVVFAKSRVWVLDWKFYLLRGPFT